MAKSLQTLGATHSSRFLYSYGHNLTPGEAQNPKAELVVVVKGRRISPNIRTSSCCCCCCCCCCGVDVVVVVIVVVAVVVFAVIVVVGCNFIRSIISVCSLN